MSNDATTRPVIDPVIGDEFLTGNSLYPRTERVLGIVAYEVIPRRERESYATLGPQHGFDHTACLYVLYRTVGSKRLESSPIDVFVATRYRTIEDMVAAYTRKAS